MEWSRRNGPRRLHVPDDDDDDDDDARVQSKVRKKNTKVTSTKQTVD